MPNVPKHNLLNQLADRLAGYQRSEIDNKKAEMHWHACYAQAVTAVGVMEEMNRKGVITFSIQHQSKQS